MSATCLLSLSALTHCRIGWLNLLCSSNPSLTPDGFRECRSSYSSTSSMSSKPSCQRYTSQPTMHFEFSHCHQVPLERYFPEYTGGPDIDKASRYILGRFMQTNRARLSVYPQYAPEPLSCISLILVVSLVQATDATTIRLVGAAVKEMILQNALKDSGVL